MNYLGIDYGTKRVGLAKATDELKIATPLATIPNDKNVFGKIREIVIREDIRAIVVGVPVSFDGKEHTFAKSVREFGLELEKSVGLPLHFQNEILTTAQAERDSSAETDASAAALILQSFLDSNNDR